MSYETKQIKQIVRLDAGDAEWDGTIADANGNKFVCIYIEPIGFTADFCAQGIDNNADHSAEGLPYLDDDANVVSSPSSGGFYEKVYLSSTSASAIKLYLAQLL